MSSARLVSQSWQIIGRLCRLWDKAEAMNLVRACVVLHDMNCEASCSDYNVDLRDGATSGDSYSSYAGARQFSPNEVISLSWEGSTTSLINLLPAGTCCACAPARKL